MNDDDPSLAARRFAAELTRLQRPLFVYIVSLVPQPSDADDVLQQANKVIWERYDDFQPNTNFAAWAYRIAYFEVLTWRKRLGRRPAQLSEETLELLAAEAQAAGLNSDRRDALRLCLDGLAEPERQLIQRRYAEDWSVDQIASELDRQANSVYRSLDRIRTRLLNCIEERLRLEGNS